MFRGATRARENTNLLGAFRSRRRCITSSLARAHSDAASSVLSLLDSVSLAVVFGLDMPLHRVFPRKDLAALHGAGPFL